MAPVSVKLSQIEEFAIALHYQDADDNTLKWAQQSSKYRNQMRARVRAFLAMLDTQGLALVKKRDLRDGTSSE